MKTQLIKPKRRFFGKKKHVEPFKYHWIIEIMGYPQRRYLRFVQPNDYSMVTDPNMAHVITGCAEFARGFCLAISLSIGGDFISITKPAVNHHDNRKTN